MILILMIGLPNSGEEVLFLLQNPPGSIRLEKTNSLIRMIS
jgi:hypothetical protein